jgi:hypothetical protein
MTAIPEDLQVWRAIRTHEDFGDAMAAWLEGRCAYQPGYYGTAPDDETQSLIPTLVMINQLGLVTINSQPGVPIDEHGNGQRAFLDGVCSAEIAGQVCDALQGTELVVVAFPPMTGGRGQIVITLDEWSEFTWCGIHYPEAEADMYGDEVGPELADLVRSSWMLQIIDPHWGRNDLLWPSVLRAVVGLPR